MQILVMFCMFLCDDKSSPAPRLGSSRSCCPWESLPWLWDAMHTLGCGTRLELGSAVLAILCSLGAVCKMGISKNWGFLFY